MPEISPPAPATVPEISPPAWAVPGAVIVSRVTFSEQGSPYKAEEQDIRVL